MRCYNLTSLGFFFCKSFSGLRVYFKTEFYFLYWLLQVNFEMSSSYILPYLVEECHFSEGLGRF